jgi:hypothetical protein
MNIKIENPAQAKLERGTPGIRCTDVSGVDLRGLAFTVCESA